MKQYNRQKTVEYAKKWAYLRNPNYYNFDNVGGDCTNFVSQCIYAGSGVMNYNKKNGWYYLNGNNKSPSWTGVQYLYNFLIQNRGIGPTGVKIEQKNLQIGDIAQLSFDEKFFSHSLIIVKIDNPKNIDNIYIAAHTNDAYNRKLSSYGAKKIRYVHIEGEN